MRITTYRTYLFTCFLKALFHTKLYVNLFRNTMLLLSQIITLLVCIQVMYSSTILAYIFKMQYIPRSHTDISPDNNTVLLGCDFINLDYILFILKLISLSGDIESNPGPGFENIPCLSVIHQNIRSIRNKMDYIKDNYLDFDVLCFTETHLSDTFIDDQLSLDGFNQIYRKDVNSHSGGLLVYVSLNIISRRILELETCLPESIWIEIRNKTHSILVCNLYRPPHYTNEFWDRLNISMELASDKVDHIVLVGDINEDQLNPRMHKFRDILTLNNMTNIINVPTRIAELSETLIDPICISDNIIVHDSGIINTPSDISDHLGTYIHLKFDSQSYTVYKRKVWYYNRADFNRLNELILTTDWSFISNDIPIDTACEQFHSKLLELLHTCIPNNLVTVRTNDKPWYNSDIRRTSRQRDRQKKIAIHSKTPYDWNKYKHLRNTVNNMKKYAKSVFFNNLELHVADIKNNNPREYWKIIKNASKKIMPVAVNQSLHYKPTMI